MNFDTKWARLDSIESPATTKFAEPATIFGGHEAFPDAAFIQPEAEQRRISRSVVRNFERFFSRIKIAPEAPIARDVLHGIEILSKVYKRLSDTPTATPLVGCTLSLEILNGLKGLQNEHWVSCEILMDNCCKLLTKTDLRLLVESPKGELERVGRVLLSSLPLAQRRAMRALLFMGNLCGEEQSRKAITRSVASLSRNGSVFSACKDEIIYQRRPPGLMTGT